MTKQAATNHPAAEALPALDDLYIPLAAAPVATTAEAPKPPPQVLGVGGMAAPEIVIHSPKVNWALVAGLPPFQMYLAECDGPNQTGENSHAWATAAAMRLAGAGGDEALIEAYSVWHAAKGYWPGETPFGAVKG